jgi:23S rRNA-/tRNA-specific pseudouridylate synthase
MLRRFESGAVTKTYLAQCHGWPEDDFFCCDEAISRDRTNAGARTLDPRGDWALTEFRVLYRGQSPNLGRWSLLAAGPRTGRTNQIRVHLWGRGFPVLGDPLYLPGRELGATQTLDPGSEPMRLHAWKLAFAHPATGASLKLRSPTPQWPEPRDWPAPENWPAPEAGPELCDACDSNESGFLDAISEET